MADVFFPPLHLVTFLGEWGHPSDLSGHVAMSEASSDLRPPAENPGIVPSAPCRICWGTASSKVVPSGPITTLTPRQT